MGLRDFFAPLGMTNYGILQNSIFNLKRSNMMRVMLSTILLLFSASWLFAEEVSSFAEAKEMAVRLNKPILIDFWSDN
jgi:hypothetical protein